MAKAKSAEKIVRPSLNSHVIHGSCDKGSVDENQPARQQAKP